MANRCEICSKETTALTETIEKKYSIYQDGKIKVCSECFNLLYTENYKEIEQKIWNKIRGKKDEGKN